jgi:hypothetical protein
MPFLGNPRDLNSVNLGRIVPPPNAGSDPSATYFPPRLYIVGAGAAGLAANAADKAAQIGVPRQQQSNTGSPNPTSNVGAAGTAGLPGTATSNLLQIIQPTSAITGPSGAKVQPTIGRTPKWVKPALFAMGGFIVAAVIFRG